MRDFQATFRVATFRPDERQKIEDVTKARNDFSSIESMYARLELLAQAMVSPNKAYAQAGDRRREMGLKLIVHGKDYNRFIKSQLKAMDKLALLKTIGSDSPLPSFSFSLQFVFTLAKPYLSQDDAPFYIIDNPVRKDKVFKVPMVAPSSWKGKLRWVATKFLADQADTLSDEEFAQRRMQLTLLFGDEKGEEPGEIKELAKYLDEAKAKRSAKELYRRKVKEYFGVDLDKPLPHHAGRLYLYPTFFDRIDLEVINPHDRRTKAGTKPIYFESVPIGAKGTFTLLYVPFDLIGRPGDHRKEVADDLETVAGAVQAMMLTYGFGAKTTSGFGVAEDALVGAGKLVIERKTYSFNSLSQLTTKAQEAASALRQGGAE
jgi:CRISPR-associated protein Cmr2